MDSSINKHQKTLAAIVHLSTFSKYIIPFGNFILPLVLWTSNKNDSDYIDHHGKQAINFQISILLYSIILGLLAIPFFVSWAWDFIGFIDLLEHNEHKVNFRFHRYSGFGPSWIYVIVAGVMALGLLVLDVFCTIAATIKANEGQLYRYPLTINFIK